MHFFKSGYSDFFSYLCKPSTTAMDIDLLSKMIKELILDTDEVSLPGVGSFVAEIVPSTFSDKGYTINPPYRRLSFRQRQTEENTMLSDFYAVSNNLDKASAELIINDFLRELKDVLQEKKTIIFPGLGRLRATRENTFFFVADEDLDIYPAGFGLSSVSLKTHEETPEAVSAAISSLKDMMTRADVPAPEPEVESVAAAEPAVEQVAEVEEEEQNPKAEPAVAVEEPAVAVEEPVVAVEAAEPAEAAAVAEDTVAAPEAEAAEGDIVVEPEAEGADEDIVVAPEAEAVEEPEEETVPFPEPAVETVPEPEQPIRRKTLLEEADYYTNPESSYISKEAGRTVLKVILWIVIAAAVLLILFVLLAHITPNLIDRILYTKEELEILRY